MGDATTNYVQQRLLANYLPAYAARNDRGRLVDLVWSHYDRRNDYNLILVLDGTGDHRRVAHDDLIESQPDTCFWLPNDARNARALVQSVCNNPEIKVGGRYVFMIDVPRGTSDKRWAHIVCGLEGLKDGFLTSCSRRTVLEKTIEPPVIVVFCKELPPEGLVSKGKFELYRDPGVN